MSSAPIVYVVHCVDTEGPLTNEPLSTTFQRLRDIFGIEAEESAATLAAIQAKQFDCGGREDEVYEVFKPEKLNFNENWEMIDAMLARITAPEFRDALPDSFGDGWVFSWHCIDHIGIDYNPRGRVLGMHQVYDHYRNIIDNWPGCGHDRINFHFHPIPFTRNATHCATHYFAQGSEVYRAIAQRMIERRFFPSVNRAGLHTLRPDSHWFMEQFIPFDLSSQAMAAGESAQADMSGGRFGDWRRAPVTWAPYHPAHDDYQCVGNCNRWIGRCLNIGGRARVLGAKDCELAFAEAKVGKPAILAFTNHDFRDMEPDILAARDMIAAAAKANPSVKFKYVTSRDAFREALGLDTSTQPSFEIGWNRNVLNVKAGKRIFGPQPFLAIETEDGAFNHDNFDFQRPYWEWSYTFDENQYPLDAVARIGIGACDEAGNAVVTVIDMKTGAVETSHL